MTDAEKLAAIREVLARVWGNEAEDPQYALEEIDRIASATQGNES